MKLLYELTLDVLRGNMNAHLECNPVLRDVFDLGPVISQCSVKMSKLQRVAMQNAASKKRNQQRQKQRYKRMVID
ncbi:unnamed protein product [Gongylonema pulchrum]|uniref:IFRD_C domain-containing protein n=1 Tax=Gongylonema pulchrum TaxID=637853 RepID=A0A183ECN5_9BILA|nr:unnamed protein product [Gongylonema pulchrum]